MYTRHVQIFIDHVRFKKENQMTGQLSLSLYIYAHGYTPVIVHVRRTTADIILLFFCLVDDDDDRWSMVDLVSECLCIYICVCVCTAGVIDHTLLKIKKS